MWKCGSMAQAGGPVGTMGSTTRWRALRTRLLAQSTAAKFAAHRDKLAALVPKLPPEARFTADVARHVQNMVEQEDPELAPTNYFVAREKRSGTL